MNKIAGTLLCLFVFLTACTSTSIGTGAEGDNAVETILVTVHNPDNEKLLGSPARIHSNNSMYGRSTRARQQLRGLIGDYQLIPRDVWAMKSLGVLCQVFDVPSSQSESILARLSVDPRVESVQLMNRFQTLAAKDEPKLPDSHTTDATTPAALHLEETRNYRSLQHNLDILDIDAVHPVVTGYNVTVAVIDTHVDIQHPNLHSSISAQFNVLQDTVTVGADAHGTAIAGIIAARPVNGHGILGIAPDARIMAITACWSGSGNVGECNSFTLARAIDLAIDKEVQIINLSLHGPPDPLLTRLVEQALAQRVVVVGAFSSTPDRAFPGSIPGVLMAAGTGTYADVLTLPGENVLTTLPQNRYDFVSGNSMAAAQLSGIAALAIEASPTLTPSAFRKALSLAIADKQKLTACQMVSAAGSKLYCANPASTTNPSSNLIPTNR